MEVEGQKSATAISSPQLDANVNLKEPQSASRMNLQLIYSSNIQASFTLFKSFIGTGILALPFAYKTAGLSLSVVMNAVIGFMLTHCFLLLLETADDKVGHKKVSFPKLAREVVGMKGKYLVQTLLMVEQLGCCIGIIIFTKDFLNHLVCSFEVESLCGNTAFNLVFSLGLTVPLSLINNMHYFYIPSFAANFFIMIGLLSQLYYNAETVYSNPEVKASIPSTLSGFHVTKLHLFFGVALYAYEGVGLTFSIRDSMARPQDLSRLLKTQMLTLTTIYIIFSSISCVALGDRLQDIVFFSLPPKDPFYLLIQILYAISALFTYPIQLFPALRIMEDSQFLRKRIFNEKGRTKNAFLRYGVRIGLIGIVFLIAYSATSFHLFLNLLGSCVFTALGFILPIWLYTVQFRGRISKKTKIINYVTLAFISIFGVISFITSFIGLVTFENE